MRQGMSLEALEAEIRRQEEAKVDYVAATEALIMGHQEGDLRMHLLGAGVREGLPINSIAHNQIAAFTGIPARYYDRMRLDAPELLKDNVNTWMPRVKARRLVRTLDGTMRAFLSDSYKPIDHLAVAWSALEALQAEPRIEVKSAQLTEGFMYLQVVTPRLQGEVVPGDVVQAGIVISNSEVGLRKASVEFLIYRLACLNGMITGTAISRRHVGSRLASEEGRTIEYQKDTVEADLKAFKLKVRDTVRHVLSDDGFQAALGKLKAANEQVIPQGKIQATVENVTKRFSLAEMEKEGLLTNLINGGNLSKYGTANAVTALAHDTENYDRGVTLERLGGEIIDLAPQEWKVITEAN